MGKETKFGLTVIGLLLGVFGLVVYFKMFRTQPAPSAEALAAALNEQQQTAEDTNLLASGPQVQLSPAADEQAPVEFAADQATGAEESEEQAAIAAPVAKWDEPRPSSRRRYADETAADESPVDDQPADDVAANADAAGAAADEFAAQPLAADSQPYSQEVDESATASTDHAAAGRFGVLDEGNSAVIPVEVAEQPAAMDAGADEYSHDSGRESLADAHAESAIDESTAAAADAEPAVLHPSEPVELSPSPIASGRGEAIQVGAEEPISETPAELDPPPPTNGSRYSRAAVAPQPYRDQEPPAAGHAASAEQEPIREAAPPIESSRNSAASRSRANAFDRRGPVAAETAVPAAAAATPAASAPPRNFERSEQSYTVEPNDNYWRISQKLYGSGGYFKALFEHNRLKYPRADRLRQGDVISAPAIEVLERTYPDLCPKPQHRAAEQSRMRAVSGRKLPPSGEVYIVTEGDTLFDIAKYELGQASRWGELYELNRDVLGEQGDHLKPGMELILPARTSRENVAGQGGNTLR